MISAPVKRLLMRFSGFSLIGAVNTLLSMLIILVMNELLGINAMVSYAVSYILTLLLAYAANAQLVFHRRLNLRHGLAFFAVYISSMFLGMVLLHLLTRLLPECNRTLMSYAVIPATMVWNFLPVNKILHKKQEDRQ